MAKNEEVKEEKIEKESTKPDQRYGGVIPGTILIVLGILFLLPRLGIDFGNLWPTFLLAPGLAFIIYYLLIPNRQKAAGILIPGLILTLLSFFFYYQTSNDWVDADKLWPIYPLVVGIAFYVFFLGSDKKDRGILIPATILSCVGILFLILNYYSFNLWPLVLIIVGLFFILTSKRK